VPDFHTCSTRSRRMTYQFGLDKDKPPRAQALKRRWCNKK
jgi:hypothetical protein